MREKFYKILENILEITIDKSQNLVIKDCKEWTSLAYIDIIMSLEDEFEIKFAREDIFYFKTTEELLQYIKNKVG